MSEPLSMSALLVPLLATLVVSFTLEIPLRPASRLRGRKAWAIALQCLAVAGLFLFFLLLTWRPLFAAAATLAFLALIVLVNNAKYQALREPMVVSDMVLFSQALRHPRLYIPFLGIGKTVLAVLAGVLVIGAGFVLEPAWFNPLRHAALLAGVLLALLGCWAGVYLIGRHRISPSLEPARDILELGIFASFTAYLAHSLACRKTRIRNAHAATINPFLQAGEEVAAGETLPDIIAIQSESFFDARRLHAGVRADILSGFDRAAATSVLSGRLQVPAWGANTMRSEFAFLTGIPNERLGFDQFNPYQSLAREPINGLASFLAARGYHCVCLHPHPVSFFSRDIVFPQMGFHEFIDIGAFPRGAEKEGPGPYISDRLVTDRVLEILEARDKPLFLFVITMENHGPLHLEQVPPEQAAGFYSEAAPTGLDALNVYLRHLAGADQMIARLTDRLKARNHPSALCFFGDHVPSMPSVYEALDFHDGDTDYFIWVSHGQMAGRRQDLAVEVLGEQLLRAAGFRC